MVWGILVLTSDKVQGIVVILGPRGEGLRVFLVVDEVSTGLYAIILPLFFLARIWSVGGELKEVRDGVWF